MVIIKGVFLKTLGNRGSQAFYNLVLSANQFHNFGTIQTNTYHFFQNYRFNSGVIKAGDTPTGVANLHKGMSVGAVPHFQNGVIDNYGKDVVKGKLEIRDRLNYHNHSESNLENLEMFGGDIKVLDGNMNISEKLSGTVKDVEISKSSALYVKTFEAKQTGKLAKVNGGMLYTPQPEKTKLEKEINDAVEERISRLPEATRQRYQRNFPKDWKISAALGNEIGLLGGGGAVSVVGGLVFGAAVSAIGGGHHGGGGIHIGVNQDGHVFAGPSRGSLQYQSRQRRNQDRYYERQVRDSMTGNHLARAVPVVYCSPLARDTNRLREALQRSRAYTSSSDYSPRHKNKSKPEFQILRAFAKTPINSVYRENRNYFSKLRTALLTANIPQNDIRTIWSDVWLRSVNNWQNLQHEERLKLIGECWQIYDIQGKIYQGRVDLEEYHNLLDTPAERFMNNVAIPLLTVGSMFTPATAPVALAGVARTAVAVTPKLMQVARALGAAEVCQEMMTFFSKKAGGDPKPRAGTGDPAPRVQATRADADKYLQGLKDKGVLGQKGVTRDGHDFFKFERKCEYNGFKFKKGDYISRDTLHNEWEYFRSPTDHQGAIDPLTGALNVAKRDVTRILRLP